MTGRPTSILAAAALLAAGLGLALNGGSHNGTVPVGSLARAKAFTVSAAVSPSSVLRNEKAVLEGAVKPVRTKQKVLIQHKVDDRWKTVAQRTMGDDGVYRYAFTAKESGDQVYRARMPKVGAVRAGASPGQVLTVAEEALVVFKIPAGTSSGDWNTEAKNVVARVGDTLRVINNDSMTHRPHTDGDPFPNPTAAESLDPGASADYVLESGFDGWLYCAIHGQTSQFWIRVKP